MIAELCACPKPLGRGEMVRLGATLVLRRLRLTSSGGKGGSTKPPGVVGCNSRDSRKFANRGCAGDDGGSTSTDRGVPACRFELEDAGGVTDSSGARGLDGESKRDSGGGFSPSSFEVFLPVKGGEGVRGDEVDAGSGGTGGDCRARKGRGWPREAKTGTAASKARYK